MLFDLGLYLGSDFCLRGKYFLFNKVVSDTEASSFSLMEIQSYWLVLRMKQTLSVMCSLNICIKTQLNVFLSLMRKTCELTKCLPPSGGEMVHCFFFTLSLPEALGLRRMSHSFTQMPIPVAGTRGFQPHSRPWGILSLQVGSKAEHPLH